MLEWKVFLRWTGEENCPMAPLRSSTEPLWWRGSKWTRSVHLVMTIKRKILLCPSSLLPPATTVMAYGVQAGPRGRATVGGAPQTDAMFRRGRRASTTLGVQSIRARGGVRRDVTEGPRCIVFPRRTSFPLKKPVCRSLTFVNSAENLIWIFGEKHITREKKNRKNHPG